MKTLLNVTWIACMVVSLSAGACDTGSSPAPKNSEVKSTEKEATTDSRPSTAKDQPKQETRYKSTDRGYWSDRQAAMGYD